MVLLFVGVLIRLLLFRVFVRLRLGVVLSWLRCLLWWFCVCEFVLLLVLLFGCLVRVLLILLVIG